MHLSDGAARLEPAFARGVVDAVPDLRSFWSGYAQEQRVPHLGAHPWDRCRSHPSTFARPGRLCLCHCRGKRKRSRHRAWSGNISRVAGAIRRHGGLPEWSKGAVCKTAGSAYVGSNPTPATSDAASVFRGLHHCVGILCPSGVRDSFAKRRFDDDACPVLILRKQMRIGVQRQVGVGLPEAGRHHLHRHSTRDQNRCVVVAQRMQRGP